MIWLESLWRGLRNLLHGRSVWGDNDEGVTMPYGKGVVADVVRLVDANKAKAAFLAPLVVALGAAAANWVVSGEFGTNEIREAAGGAVLAFVSGVVTWLTPAKKAEVIT